MTTDATMPVAEDLVSYRSIYGVVWRLCDAHAVAARLVGYLGAQRTEDADILLDVDTCDACPGGTWERTFQQELAHHVTHQQSVFDHRK